MRVEDVLDMTPSEYQGWIYHLQNYPPIENLVAYIAWAQIGHNKNIDPSVFGFWLEGREQREQRAKDRRSVKAMRTRLAYERSKDEKLEPDSVEPSKGESDG